MPFTVKPFSQSLAFYRSQHRTPGCRLTHMFGVPLLTWAALKLAARQRGSLPLYASGTILQFVGHWFFEKNSPTLMETGDLMTIPAALVFVAQQWLDVLTGRWLSKNGLNLWERRSN